MYLYVSNGVFVIHFQPYFYIMVRFISIYWFKYF